MSSYTYRKINELEAGTQMQNFYGKIIFYGKEGDRLVLLMKDETGMMYVWVKPKEGQKLNFAVKMNVRIHRCMIGQSSIGKFATVTIGKAGCHLIAWPKNGRPEAPSVISSMTWSKSSEDTERIKKLSELDVDGPSASVESVAKKLIEIREAQRAKVVVSKWLSHAKNEDLTRKNLAAMDIFGNPPHSEIFSNCSFTIDQTFFNEPNLVQFLQFYVTCPKCYDGLKEVRYTKDPQLKRCFRCKTKLRDVELAFRVRAELEEVNLVFTIPIHLLPDHSHFPQVTFEDYIQMTRGEEVSPKVEKFVGMLQRKFWSSAIKDVKGRVMGRSDAWSFVEVLVTETKFIGLNDV